MTKENHPIHSNIILPKLPDGLNALIVPTREMALYEAAPELLAALKALIADEYAVECQECGIGQSAAWLAAQRAIAKAEGRS